MQAQTTKLPRFVMDEVFIKHYEGPDSDWVPTGYVEELLLHDTVYPPPTTTHTLDVYRVSSVNHKFIFSPPVEVEKVRVMQTVMRRIYRADVICRGDGATLTAEETALFAIPCRRLVGYEKVHLVGEDDWASRIPESPESDEPDSDTNE
jgi:hypothetical protein